MQDKYLSDVETFIRKSLSEENEAIAAYTERAELAKMYAEDLKDTNSELSDKLFDLAYVLNDIKQEEEVHIGELNAMLELLDLTNNNENKGKEEAEENIDKKESFISISKKLSSVL